MGWHTVAGIAQVVLVAFVVARHATAGARRRRELMLYVVPMLGLAIGTLAGVGWVVVVAAIFYSLWLINHLLSWRDRPAQRLAHVVLGLISIAVLATTWLAATAAHAGIAA